MQHNNLRFDTFFSNIQVFISNLHVRNKVKNVSTHINKEWFKRALPPHVNYNTVKGPALKSALTMPINGDGWALTIIKSRQQVCVLQFYMVHFNYTYSPMHSTGLIPYRCHSITHIMHQSGINAFVYCITILLIYLFTFVPFPSFYLSPHPPSLSLSLSLSLNFHLILSVFVWTTVSLSHHHLSYLLSSILFPSSLSLSPFLSLSLSL